MSNSVSSSDITIPIPQPLNYILTQPLTEKEERAQVSAYLVQSRECRRSISKSAFLTLLRIWLRTRAIGRPGAKIDGLMTYWNDMSVDDVFNKAMATARLEIQDLRRGRIAKLSQFTATVVEYILDRETYPEVWPLDRKALDAETWETLDRFKPPYMYKGCEYSAEECAEIHEEMSLGQIVSEITRARAVFTKILKRLSPEALAEIDMHAEEHVREEFTLDDAFVRYERLGRAKKV